MVPHADIGAGSHRPYTTAPRPHDLEHGRAPAQELLDPRRPFTVGLCIPMEGTVGIWAPSAMASASLACAELNQGSGIGGRECRLLVVNAAVDAPDLEVTMSHLLQTGAVDALVGSHPSTVRQRIRRVVGGQLPFIYGTLYEGHERSPGVFAIGETNEQLLRPAIRWLHEHAAPKRWIAVGNDYVWPRLSNAMARNFIQDSGGQLLDELYVPIGTTDFSSIIERLKQSRADVVLLTLIGQDGIDFNRAFGEAGLARSMRRLSSCIAENELLALSPEDTDELYAVTGYFSALQTEANLAFKQRYCAHFGERAPTLSTFGQATYEGVHFLAGLMASGATPQALGWTLPWTVAPFQFRSARETVGGRSPAYLARADGCAFRVLARL